MSFLLNLSPDIINHKKRDPWQYCKYTAHNGTYSTKTRKYSTFVSQDSELDCFVGLPFLLVAASFEGRGAASPLEPHWVRQLFTSTGQHIYRRLKQSLKNTDTNTYTNTETNTDTNIESHWVRHIFAISIHIHKL